MNMLPNCGFNQFQSEGDRGVGSLEVKNRATTLRGRGRVTALCTLTSVSNELSLPNIGIDEERVEQLGRKFFCKPKAAARSSGGETPATARSPGGETPATDFWQHNEIHFPQSWPDKLTLPVSINDPGKFPLKYRLLALDEVVLAFWKMVGHVAGMVESSKAEVTKAKSSGGETPDDAAKKKITDCEQKFQVLEALMDSARRLHRNVPISFVFVESESARHAEAISLREEVESLREYVGLTGWHRVVIAGSKRDELRSSLKRSVKPEEVAAALATVRWGPGREMSSDVAEKLLLLYDRFANSKIIVDLIATVGDPSNLGYGVTKLWLGLAGTGGKRQNGKGDPPDCFWRPRHNR